MVRWQLMIPTLLAVALAAPVLSGCSSSPEPEACDTWQLQTDDGSTTALPADQPVLLLSVGEGTVDSKGKLKLDGEMHPAGWLSPEDANRLNVTLDCPQLAMFEGPRGDGNGSATPGYWYGMADHRVELTLNIPQSEERTFRHSAIIHRPSVIRTMTTRQIGPQNTRYTFDVVSDREQLQRVEWTTNRAYNPNNAQVMVPHPHYPRDSSRRLVITLVRLSAAAVPEQQQQQSSQKQQQGSAHSAGSSHQ